MRVKNIPYILALILFVQTFAEDYEGRYYGINFGAGPSKTLLGGFYSWNRNQINLGTNLAFYTFEEGFIVAQPTITYNRYLTENGFYVSAGLITTFIADQDHEVREPAVAPDTGWRYRTVDESDWERPWLSAGLGKNFQWPRWGAHIDATLFSPIGNDFMNRWTYWIGAGVSYRFKLDE